jgi:hypothetical protein
MAKRQKEPMREECAADLATSVHRRGIGPKSGGIYPQNIGFPRTCQRRHLSKAFETACGPKGCSLMENTSFGGFSASLRRPNQLVAMAEFWFTADWPPYLPDWNSFAFSTCSVLQPKGQATPHTNLGALRPYSSYVAAE